MCGRHLSQRKCFSGSGVRGGEGKKTKYQEPLELKLNSDLYSLLYSMLGKVLTLLYISHGRHGNVSRIKHIHTYLRGVITMAKTLQHYHMPAGSGTDRFWAL